ncbi:hypothetical protein M513_13629 [Trichuris suis]|uniref:Integrase catalytic domain-containing protein n=1 Tax=Trichuris suis TaxID=68888 RepID=A0A085LKJ4_9BILA|nr:hypothetical protein M513_13629 [Trichuris suis]
MFSRSSYGHRFPITLADYYGMWPDVHFTQRASTADIICLLKETFSPEGIPMEIVSDNGVQFCSDEFRLFLRYYDIRGGSHLAESRFAHRSHGRQSFGRLVVWPTGRMADRSFGRLVIWPTGRLAEWSFGRLVFWTTGRSADTSLSLSG